MAPAADEAEVAAPSGGGRTARRLRRALAALAVLLVGLFVVRSVLVAPLLARLVERVVERRTGVGIVVGSVGGRVLGRVALRGIRTVRPGVTGPFVSFDVDALTIRYSPADLLRGLDALLGGARIDVDGGRVVVNLAPPGPAGASGGAAYVVVPELRVRWLDVLAERPGLIVRVGGLSADTGARLPAGGRELTLKATSLNVDTPALLVGPIPVVATLRPAVSGVEAAISVPGRSIRGTVAYSPAAVDARAVLEAVPLGAGAVRLPGGEVSGTLSADVRVHADPERGIIVEGSAALERGVVRGVPVERMRLAGAMAADVLRLGSLEAESGPNRLTLSHAVVPLGPLRARDAAATLRAAAGSFTAQLGDVPALLALAGRPPAIRGGAPPHRLEIEGTIGGGVVEVTAGRLTLPGGGVRVERFRATAPPPDAPWSAAQVDASADVELADIGLLERLFPLPPLAGSLTAGVVVGGELGALTGSVRATARGLAVNGRAIGDVDVDAVADGGRVLVRAGRLLHAGGANRLSFDGLSLRLADLVDRRWRALASGASGSFAAELHDVPALMALVGRAAGRSARSVPPHVVRLSGRLDGGTVAVPAATLAVAGGSVQLSGGRAALPPEGRRWDAAAIAAAIEADLPDLAAVSAVFATGAVGGALRASVQVGGTVREPEGRFSASVERLTVGAVGPLRGSVAGGFSGGAGDVESLALESGDGSVALAGRIERESGGAWRLRLGSLVVRRGGAEARLVAPAAVRYAPPGLVTTDRLSVAGPDGSLTLSGTAAPGGGSDLSFEAAGLGSDGWLAGLLGKRITVRGLDARGRLTGSRARPGLRVAGQVAALGGVGAADPLSGRFEFAYEPPTLTVVSFEWSDGRQLNMTAAGTLPVDLLAGGKPLPGTLDFKASLRAGDLRALSFLFPPSAAPVGALEADLAVGGSWERPEGELTARATAVGVPGAAALKGRAPLTASLEATLRGGDAQVRSLTISSEDVSAEASGAWTGLPDLGKLLRRERPLLSGSVALKGRFSAADLSALRAVAGNPRRLSGRLSGDFAVSGPIADPAVDADVRLDDGALEYADGMPPLANVAAAARVRGRTATIERASGEAGGAPFTVGGEVSWGDGGLRADLSLQGANLLLYRDERVVARADVDLRARGPLEKLRIDGTVSLQNSVYSRNVSLADLVGGRGRRRSERASGVPFSLRRAPWSGLEFAVDIDAGSPFQIRSNLARGAVRPELRLTGTGRLPVLAGNVFVESTRVSLPAGTLLVDRGIVTFPEPGTGEPRIDLSGRTRLLGYDVTVVVGGTLRAPEVTLSSVPPLPEDELLLLVVAGTPPGTADEKTMNRILEANLARFVAESLIDSVAGDREGVADLTERIEVEIGREVTRAGAATIETRFRLAGGTGSTGRFFYLSGGTDVYDTYTMGVTVVFRFR